MRGPRWTAGDGGDDEGDAAVCAQCGERLGDARVTIVRHRGEHRVPDAFCSVDHLVEWAKSGGRWAT